MTRQWKEVVRLRFKGPRFEGHALDLMALGELSQFQKIVAETAKALWYAANPDAGRLPNNFEDRIRLYLRKIVDGSAIAPLEVELDQPEEATLPYPPQPPREVIEAADLAWRVFDSADRGMDLPDGLPKSLLPEYLKWGQMLADDEEIEISALDQPGRAVARVNRPNRERLRAFAETPHEATADIIAEVFEADIRAKRFQVRLAADQVVSVNFSAEQEELVTSALKDHETIRVRVRGRGEFSPDGKLVRFRTIDDLSTAQVAQETFVPGAPAIEDVLAQIAAEVPAQEWARLPQDLSSNLDRHIYGELE